MMQFHMTRVSNNRKTGPIPVTTSSSSTCPSTCPLKGSGCYAESGPLGMHWRAVDGTRGYDLERLCAEIAALPKQQLWRWAQAGDLPGDGTKVSTKAVNQLIKANTGRRGFGYTHYDPTIKANAKAIAKANASGFTLNLSANNLAHADALMATGTGPVVTVLPEDAPKTLRTPAGHTVTRCPAYDQEIDCARCGACAVPTRKGIIGFPAHGSGRKKAHKVFMMAAA